MQKKNMLPFKVFRVFDVPRANLVSVGWVTFPQHTLRNPADLQLAFLWKYLFAARWRIPEVFAAFLSPRLALGLDLGQEGSRFEVPRD